LGTEESNEAELALEKDCFTLELEEQHLVDFHNGALGTEDFAEAKLVLEGSRGKPSLSIAALESNDSFFPEATLPKSTRCKDRAKATVAMRQPSSLAKRRSLAKGTIPRTIAVRTVNIQPRTPSAYASSSRAKLPVRHA
jgi:hypothetical protein